MTASIDAASGVTTQSIGKIKGEYKINKRGIVKNQPHQYDLPRLKILRVVGLPHSMSADVSWSRNSYSSIPEREHATVRATRFSVASLLIWGCGFASCEKK
jgi:hypothetical protein